MPSLDSLSRPNRRRLPSARRAPRASSWPRRGARWTSPPRAGRSRRPGRRARPRARPAPPRPSRSRPRASSPAPARSWSAASARRPAPAAAACLTTGLARLADFAGLRAFLAHADVLGPAADVGVQRLVLDGDGARADGVQQRAVVGDQQQRALEGLQRVLERLAALDVEVVGRLVEDQDVGAGVHEDRQREPLALAAAEPVDRLLGLLAAEQELAQQRPRLVRRQPGRALAGLDHRARPAACRPCAGRAARA